MARNDTGQAFAGVADDPIRIENKGRIEKSCPFILPNLQDATLAIFGFKILDDDRQRGPQGFPLAFAQSVQSKFIDL